VITLPNVEDRPTILLVEDDAQLRSMLGEMLRRHYKVVESEDGLKALARLEDGSPAVDLVVTDIAMPEMNGVELMRKLPESLPVIVMSGYLSTFLGEMEVLKPAAVLEKPFRQADLLREVRQVLAEAMHSGRILVVDDDAMVRSAVQLMLESAGYAVDAAIDGEDGLKRYSATPADLVVVDVFMPNMSGIELVDKLRELNPDVRVLVMSGVDARDGLELEALTRSARVEGRIGKPFGVSDLLRKVRDVLDGPEESD